MAEYQRVYQLSRYGNLLLVNATVGAKNIKLVLVSLLMDIGASYTILPVNLVKGVGGDISNPLSEIMVTAQGIINLLVESVGWLNCVGQFIENFEVVA